MEGLLAFCAINSHASPLKGCVRYVLDEGWMTVKSTVMLRPQLGGSES